MDKPAGATKSFDGIKSIKKHYMKILVTGGAGFIGSSLSDYLLNKTDAEVVQWIIILQAVHKTFLFLISFVLLKQM
jgi:predicted MFS family arabinose efflux permease